LLFVMKKTRFRLYILMSRQEEEKANAQGNHAMSLKDKEKSGRSENFRRETKGGLGRVDGWRQEKDERKRPPRPPSLNVPWVIVSRTPLCPVDSEKRKRKCFPERW
jgi:hypothetical protein